MILATSKERNPTKTLHEVCRIKGVDESELIEALETWPLGSKKRIMPPRKIMGCEPL